MTEKNNYCKHEVDPATVVYDKKYGRRCKCKYCGCNLYMIRENTVKHEHRTRMSKKDRKRAKEVVQNV